MSLITVINKIKDACNAHALIQDVEAGYIWDRTIGDREYPLVYIDLNPSVIEGKKISHRVTLYIADRIPLGFQNVSEVETSSNMLEIFFDLRMRMIDSGLAIQDSINFAPFTEDENDMLAGVIVDLDIIETDNKDRCNFPTK